MNLWAVQNLRAATIGPSVPYGYFLVKIHSIFRKAINLRLLECCEVKKCTTHNEVSQKLGQTKLGCVPPIGNVLITILSRESFNYPQGILLSSVEDFTDYNLRQNDLGTFSKDGIGLTQYGTTKSSFYVSFADAVRIKHRAMPYIALPYTATWQTSVELLTTMQNIAMVELSIAALVGGSATCKTVSKLLTDAAINLGRSLQSMDMCRLCEATHKLIGFGSGLTPSGDDFLCGFIAAAHCQHNIRVDHLFELSKIILANLEKTNAISATFLSCTIKGEVCNALYDFAKAIHSGARLEERLKRLCTIGHSSGMDIATGFLYGLKIWGNQSKSLQ